MAKKRKEVPYSYAEFNRDCFKIAAWAKRRSRQFTGVYGPPRGGIWIAVRLSHILHVPYVHSQEDVTPDTLVVDDIVYRGKMMGRLAAKFGPGFHMASLFFDPGSRRKPEFSVHTTRNWIKFPWEEEDEPQQYDKTTL